MFWSTTTTTTTSGFSVFVPVFILLQLLHICTPRCVFCDGDYGVNWVAWVGVVQWPVHSRLCLGRCGMIRGLTGVPQPVLASQSSTHSASQPASQPAGKADRQAGRHRERQNTAVWAGLHYPAPSIDSPCGIFPLWHGIIYEHTPAQANPTHRHRHMWTDTCTPSHMYAQMQQKWKTHIWTTVGWSW